MTEKWLDFTEFEYTNTDGNLVELQVRNVGDKNQEAEIQIEETEYREKRIKRSSISILSKFAEDFIRAVSRS